MTIEQNLKLFSLSRFQSIKHWMGHPQLRYEQINQTVVDLDNLGTLKDVTFLKLIGLSYTAKKLSLPKLEIVRIEESTGEDVAFLQASPLLKTVVIEQSHIKDVSALPLETIEDLRIISSEDAQPFPGKLLKRCTSLKNLELENIHIDGFSLSDCKELTNLSLTKVTSDEVPSLRSLSKLTHVQLKEVSSNLLSMFAKVNHVQRLQLSKLHDISLQALSKAKNWKLFLSKIAKELTVRICPLGLITKFVFLQTTGSTRSSSPTQIENPRHQGFAAILRRKTSSCTRNTGHEQYRCSP